MSEATTMRVEPNKVNLAEKDIEDWLFENPNAISFRVGRISQWIARQYSMPSGIADLIGIYESEFSPHEAIAVVEVKNVAINKAAVLQVCRYASDVQEIVMNRVDHPTYASGEPIVYRILVGPSIDAQTFAEAKACRVHVITFGVTFTMRLGDLDHTREYQEQLEATYERLAAEPKWGRYGETITDKLQRMYGESPSITGAVDEASERSEFAGE